MTDVSVKMLLTSASNVLDELSNQVCDMRHEATLDRQNVMTRQHAASFLREIRESLGVEFGRIIDTLEEVVDESVDVTPQREVLATTY